MIKKIAFVSLRSKDIDADKRFYGEVLRASGVEFRGGIQDRKVCKMAWAIDPSGNTIMLHEIAADRC